MKAKIVKFLGALTVVLATLNPQEATADGKVYWSESPDGVLRRANLDGSDVEDLFPIATNYIALDIARGKIYNTQASLVRRDLDGSDLEVLVSGDNFRGIALDLTADKMYWADGNLPNRIRRANLDGSAIEDLIVGAASERFRGPTLDLSAGKMYWSGLDGSDSHFIRRANLDGSGVQDLFEEVKVLAGQIFQVALDTAGGKMYWTRTTSAGQIQRANLDGSGTEDILTDLFIPRGIALDAVGGKMYWTQGGGGGVSGLFRANLDGSAIESLVSTGLPIAIALQLEVDELGPIISNTQAAPNPAAVTESIILTANVDDSTTGGSNIASAEYFIFDSSLGCVMPPDGLISWWPGDGNTSDIFDGNSPTQTLGSPVFEPAKVGQGIKFTGDDGLIVPDNPNLNFGSDRSFTLDAWVRVDGLGVGSVSDDALVDKRVQVQGTTDRRGYLMDVLHPPFSPPGTVAVELSISEVDALTVEVSTSPFPPGELHFVAGVVDREAQTMSMYLDGVLQQQASIASVGNITSSPGRLFIGHHSLDAFTFVRPLNGLLDEVEIYNCALSQAQIQSIFDAGAAGKCKAVRTPMTAVDGAFDEVNEDVTAVIPPQLPGVYEVCVRGTDIAGNIGDFECTELAVYDPNGGFVTGAGVVHSPAGADLANPSATGPAQFAFVSKYVAGMNTPTGNLRFRFRQGNLTFDSTSMEWLVVTGEPRAIFRGEGTLNGSTTCKFEVDAWDASFQPGNEDAFGLKIFACSSSGDRYNLTATQLTGGNIMINGN